MKKSANVTLEFQKKTNSYLDCLARDLGLKSLWIKFKKIFTFFDPEDGIEWYFPRIEKVENLMWRFQKIKFVFYAEDST